MEEESTDNVHETLILFKNHINRFNELCGYLMEPITASDKKHLCETLDPFFLIFERKNSMYNTMEMMICRKSGNCISSYNKFFYTKKHNKCVFSQIYDRTMTLRSFIDSENIDMCSIARIIRNRCNRYKELNFSKNVLKGAYNTCIIKLFDNLLKYYRENYNEDYLFYYFAFILKMKGINYTDLYKEIRENGCDYLEEAKKKLMF